VVGGLIAVAVSFLTLGPWGALPLGVAGLFVWRLAAYLRRRLGGFTGDTLGALVETVETGVLTVAVSLDFLELA
jgi:adenosylcobinamide-GDP ribazoletransferase